MEWITRPLGEITSYMAKGIPPKYTEEETENTVRVLNQKCNRNFTISYADSRIHDCTQKKVPSDKLLKKGDVLINSTGTGTAGRVAQMMEIPIPTTIDGHMILLRPSKEIDAFYYGYAVKAHQAQIETLAEGSTGQTEINRNRLQTEVMITYPEDKKVQAGIASFLWDIDRKIEVNNNVNKNLYEQCVSLFSELFEGKEWEEDSLEKCTSQIVRGKSGEYVEHSKYANLNQKVNKGFILEKQYYKYLDESIDIPEEKFGRPKDIILNSLGQGTLGRVHFLFDVEPNVVIDQHISIIRTNERMTPEYLYFMLASSKYQDIINNSVAGSTGMLMLNISVVRGLKVEVPPISKQEEFSKIVEPMYALIEKNNSENEKLTKLRDSLLPKLMSGELDVSELDI